MAFRTTYDLGTCAIRDLGYTTGSVAKKYQAHQDFFRGQGEPYIETFSLGAGWFQMTVNFVEFGQKHKKYILVKIPMVVGDPHINVVP